MDLSQVQAPVRMSQCDGTEAEFSENLLSNRKRSPGVCLTLSGNSQVVACAIQGRQMLKAPGDQRQEPVPRVQTQK